MTDAPATPEGVVPKPRFLAVDALRGYAILIVVVAHVIWGLRVAGAPIPDLFPRIYDWIYLYAAQLLFFVSGCLAGGSLRHGRKALVISKVRGILYPYVVWSVLTWCLRALSPVKANAPAQLEQMLLLFLHPYDIYWFLYELFLFFMAYAALSRAGNMALAAVATVLFSLHGFVSLPLALNLFCAHFFYFALGAIVFPVLREMVRESSSRRLLLALAVALFLMHAAGAREALDVYGVRPYDDVLAAAPVLAALFGFFFFFVWCRQGRTARMFVFLGGYSMQIYVAHTIFTAGTRIALLRGLGLSDPWLHLAAGTVCGVLGPLILYGVLKKMRCDFLYRV
ncbi:MAG: acyltransferase [Desulfovibrio sp.]|nr:acyltransferase [Desulfovibrio sp.]